VKSGLKEGELVIVSGIQKVSPGVVVNPVTQGARRRAGPPLPARLQPRLQPREMRPPSRHQPRPPTQAATRVPMAPPPRRTPPMPGKGGGCRRRRMPVREPPMISKTFVDRPRLAAVVSIVLVVAGLLAMA
jgi:hypothetical protein